MLPQMNPDSGGDDMADHCHSTAHISRKKSLTNLFSCL